MRTFTAVCALVLAAAACGGSSQPPEGPPSGAASPSAIPVANAQPAPPPEAPPAPASDAAAEPAPAPKPKSAATIGGASVSEVDGTALQSELKKLGWLEPNASVGGMAVGAYQNVRTDIKKGKAKGYVEIIRPTQSVTSGGGSNMVPPKDQKDERDKEGAATYYDDSADVLVVVSVEGKPADAKRLLGSLVKNTSGGGAGKDGAKGPAAKKK